MYPLDQFQAKKWGCFCQWRSILTFWTYWKQLAHIYLTSNDITKRIFIPVYQYGHPKKEIHLNLQWYHRLCFFLLKKCNPKEFYPIDDHQLFNMELLCALSLSKTTCCADTSMPKIPADMSQLLIYLKKLLYFYVFTSCVISQ